jgi:hypothetical protein
MGLTLVECEPALVPRVQDFFKRVYRPSYRLAWDDELFRWQFGATSAAGSLHIKLALLHDEIQGCLGYIPVECSIGGRAVAGAWTANWIVDPQHRGRALGPLLLRELTSEFDTVLAVGLTQAASDVYQRLGWSDLGPLQRYVAVLDVRAAASLTATGTLLWPGPSSHAPDTTRRGVRHDGPLTDEVDELWDRAHGRAGAGTRRNASFLNWRYTDHPRFEYRAFLCRSSAGDLQALAIYRVETVRDSTVRVGRIVEVVATPEWVVPVLAGLVDDAAADGVALLDFLCSSRALAAPLAAIGFLPGDSASAGALPLVFQPVDWSRTSPRFMVFDRKLSQAITPDAWYVTSGDGDQDRPN